ncbi:MAG TPA: NRDE family protein [Burkholderiaceae bacterium]|nr:NRDE family protein [Burkholderiaceae bacterium]
MCLILIGWQSHPDFPLVIAANRDEFYTRRTRPAAWWGQSVSILAGRDEEAGGTWFGINRRGRVALLTNVRAPQERNAARAPSRGLLVLSALQSAGPLASWTKESARAGQSFNGYNLLVGEPLPAPARGIDAQILYTTNRTGPDSEEPRALAPGIYGLSNGLLDTPWPKVTRGVTAFACQLANRIDVDALLGIMANREIARDAELPHTGVPLDWERALSAIQIRAKGYGTRATTILTVRRDGTVHFFERAFSSDDPEQFVDRQFEFVIDGTGYRAPILDSPPRRERG